MEVRPGYKQTEVGSIPEEWDVLPLAALGTFSKGQGIRKSETATGDVPCVRYGEIYTLHHDVVRSYYSHISRTVARTSKRLSKGDILFAGSGETKEEIGKAVAFVDDREAYAGGDIVILSPRSASSEYLGYLLNSPRVTRQKASRGQGDAVVHISASALGAVVIPVPPVSEQRAIAAALGDVDALLDGLDRLIAKKRDLKQAAMQQLLTGRTRLPGFLGEWESTSLGAHGVTYGGLVSKRKEDFGAGDARYVTFMNVMSNVVVDSSALGRVRVSSSESQTLVRQGDLLFNGSSETPEEVAFCAVLLEDVPELYLNSFCFGYRPHARLGVDPLFLAYLFRSRVGREMVKSLAQGSTRYNISKSALMGAQVALPQLTEQVAISSLLSDMDAEIAALEARRGKTRALKQAIVQVLLTGRVRLV